MKAIKIGLTEFPKKFFRECREQKYKETNQVNGHSQEEPMGEILMCFLSSCSNPIHQTRMTFHSSQHVLKLPFTSESLRTDNTLGRVDKAHIISQFCHPAVHALFSHPKRNQLNLLKPPVQAMPGEAAVVVGAQEGCTQKKNTDSKGRTAVCSSLCHLSIRHALQTLSD